MSALEFTLAFKFNAHKLYKLIFNGTFSGTDKVGI